MRESVKSHRGKETQLSGAGKKKAPVGAPRLGKGAANRREPAHLYVQKSNTLGLLPWESTSRARKFPAAGEFKKRGKLNPPRLEERKDINSCPNNVLKKKKKYAPGFGSSKRRTICIVEEGGRVSNRIRAQTIIALQRQCWSLASEAKKSAPLHHSNRKKSATASGSAQKEAMKFA